MILMSPALAGGFFITCTTWEAPHPLPTLVLAPKFQSIKMLFFPEGKV